MLSSRLMVTLERMIETMGAAAVTHGTTRQKHSHPPCPSCLTRARVLIRCILSRPPIKVYMIGMPASHTHPVNSGLPVKRCSVGLNGFPAT